MRDILFLLLFACGLVWIIWKRVSFEKSEQGLSKAYTTLFREHNTMLMLIFTALLLERLLRVLEVNI